MFCDVAVEFLEMNPFTAIGEDTFLITAGTAEHFNTMNASWGSIGVIWGRNALTIYVRESRYTHSFLDKCDGFTVSFFPPEYKEKLRWCGEHSGRDYDKVAETGLKPTYITGPKGDERVTFKQASLVFSCTKAAVLPLPKESFLLEGIQDNYPGGDYHTIYIGFIDSILSNQ